MFGMKGFYISTSGAIQGYHGPLISFSYYWYFELSPTLQSVEDKHQAVLRINQTLESQILQLNTELEELRSKLHSK